MIGCDAKKRKQARRDDRALDALRHVAAGEVEVDEIERGDPLVAARLFFPIEILRRGDRDLIQALRGEFLEEQDEILRRLEWQRADEERVDQTEDRGVRGDRQRDRDDGDTAVKPGALTRLRKSETERCAGVMDRGTWKLANMRALLMTERFERIQARGPARRDVAGEKADAEEEQADKREAERIVRGDAMQAARKEFHEEIRADETDKARPMPIRRTPWPGDQTQDVAGLRAERHADADFLGPLPNRIRHHAIQTERRRGRARVRQRW